MSRKACPVRPLTGIDSPYAEFSSCLRRRAETVIRCLEAELSFYGRVFGFTPSS